MATTSRGSRSTADELSLLIDYVRDYAMFILSPEGEIRTWNPGAARIFGYETDEAIGRKFFMFYGDADFANRRPHRELEVAAEKGRVEDEGWRIRADGTRFWASTIITALRNDDGTLHGFAKITRDLTERKMAEEQLRQNEEMFRLLVASVREYAIFLLDLEGRITTWNAGAHRIKQYTEAEIIGRHFSIFYPPEDIAARKPERELEIALRDGSVEDEGWRLRKDGTRFWANVVITAVHTPAGELRGFAKVTRDFTDRKRAEEELLEQHAARIRAEQERNQTEASFRALQEANRAKDEFLMTLSHELRTPLTAILGWSRLLPTIDPGDAEFSEAIRAITRSAEHQVRLIEDVLDVSRVVSGKLRLVVETVDAAPILHAALDAVRPAADAKEIRIATDVPDDLGGIAVDPTRFQQVIWNLLSNAVKFTPRFGRVELTARRTSNHLRVLVKDTGEGIDPAFVPHVFDPFRQAESSTTRVHGGLGLGLSIVRYLVEAHGGTVSAHSAGKGEGAEFMVTLPVFATQTPTGIRSTAPHRDDHAPTVLTRLDGVKLLVVDDDEGGREVVAAALRRSGASAVTASSVAAAWDELARHDADVIISDIAMPGVDGFEFLRQLRNDERTRTKKVVALTAFGANVRKASPESFDLVLVKPIDPFTLTASVAEVVGRTRR